MSRVLAARAGELGHVCDEGLRPQGGMRQPGRTCWARLTHLEKILGSPRRACPRQPQAGASPLPEGTRDSHGAFGQGHRREGALSWLSAAAEAIVQPANAGGGPRLHLPRSEGTVSPAETTRCELRSFCLHHWAAAAPRTEPWQLPADAPRF